LDDPQNYPNPAEVENSNELSLPELRKRAAACARSTWPGVAKWQMDETAVREVFEELHLHRVELEIQNEELRQAQAELEVSRVRYFSLFDQTPVGYFTLDSEGVIRTANLRAIQVLTDGSRSLDGRPLTEWIFRDDQDTFYLSRRRMVKTGAAQVCELRMRRVGGSPFWVRLEMCPEQDGVCHVTIVDIDELTLRKDRLEMAVLECTATLREQAQELRRLAEERDVLLREVHHRVRNNLQVISTLLRMHAEQVNDRKIEAALNDSHRRFLSMAMIQEAFYQKGHMHQIDFQEYTHNLLSDFFRASGKSDRIRSRVITEAVVLPVDQAIPCGLILNELVSNAVKHAYPSERDGEIEVNLKESADGEVRIAVEDYGVGLPERLDWQRPKSMGLRIIQMLTKQIEGKLRVESGPPTIFEVRFVNRLRKRI
jgi:two-component sensor histidine kinase